MKRLLPLIVAVLSGCATSYQENSFTGGYSDTQLAPDLFRVSYTGNGYSSSGRVQDFALLRAAELSLKNGFSHFSVVSAADASKVGVYTAPTTSTTTGTATRIGQTTAINANTVNSGGYSVPIHKPGVDLMIRCYKTKPGFEAFDAAFLAQSVKAKYKLK